jgi:soluble lytic murein transglycosylase
VLAFSTIYDWRLNGNALPLSDRLRGRMNVSRKQFVCPLVMTTPADKKT